MAKFLRIRARLARFRRILEAVLIVQAVYLGAISVALWLNTNEAGCLLLGLMVCLGAFISVVMLRRDLQPETDLRKTVQLLNANKKLYRKRLGVRLRFSTKWFPFGSIFRRRSTSAD